MAPSRSCVVISGARAEQSKQGLGYFIGVSAQSAGATGICAHLITIPPAGRAKAHLHEHHESAIYLLHGAVITWFGDALGHWAVTREGDFLYIPAGTPHLPVNMSDTEEARALVARTDPNDQESVVLLPHLGLAHTTSTIPSTSGEEP